MSLSFFLEMAVKSAVIAGAGLLLAALLRRRSAADRAAVLRLAIALLLLLPLLSAFLPALQVEVAREVSTAAAAAPAAAAGAGESWLAAGLVGHPGALAEASSSFSVFDDPGILIAIAYFVGLLMAAARLGAGLWTLARWTRDAEPLCCPEWAAAFARIRAASGLPDGVRLLLSNEAPAPLSWGWRNPLILIDPDTARRVEDAEAILEHEAAHILRSDWPALIVARAASALFWFNPLVWAVERSLVQNTEEAADSCAVGRVEPAHYARILLSCADQLCRPALPANSMTGSAAMGRRIKAVLDSRFREARPGSALAVLAMACCVAFAGPVSAMKFVLLTVTQPAPAARVVEGVPAKAAALAAAAVSVKAEDALAEAVSEGVGEAVEAAVEAAVEGAGMEAAVEAAAPLPAIPAPLPVPAPAAAPAPVRALAALSALHPTRPAPPATPARPAQPKLLDVDTLVAMKIHGVSDSFISGLAALGPAYAGLPAQKMIDMRIHGVSTRFIREMADAGYAGLSPDQLIGMRIHGVSADRARRAAEKLGRRPSPDELVTMAIHGIR